MTTDHERPPDQVDILVSGGGMAGLAAATVAAEAGARVVVVEKDLSPGGSAALSVGMFWAMPDTETLRRRVPLGDPDLGQAVVENYPSAVEVISEMSVSVGEQVSGVMTAGIGHSIDVRALLDYEIAAIKNAGGQIVCNTAARSLVTDADGAVIGAVLRGSDGRRTTVRAGATILATGPSDGVAVTRGKVYGALATLCNRKQSRSSF